MAEDPRDVVVAQLFDNGPTRDGDIIDKEIRNELYQGGYVDRLQGWNWLTRQGMAVALLGGGAQRKDAKRYTT